MIFSKIRVLIVDDDKLMRAMVSGILQRIGIEQLQEAADGKSALVAAIKFQPHLVLSDVHMESMNGIEFVKKLRTIPHPAIANARVIFMTADTSEETLRGALSLGIRGYIIKPPSADALKAKIEAAMK